jgi:quinoprotein glucose dehydrogenase
MRSRFAMTHRDRPPPARSARPRLVLVTVPAIVGAGLGGDALFGTETGVDGTWGALLAFAGALAVAAGGLLGMLVPLGPGLRRTLDLLLGAGALLTAFAAWMLMRDVFALAMILAFAGLLAAVAAPSRTRRPA